MNPESMIEVCGSLLRENTRLSNFWSLQKQVSQLKFSCEGASKQLIELQEGSISEGYCAWFSLPRLESMFESLFCNTCSSGHIFITAVGTATNQT